MTPQQPSRRNFLKLSAATLAPLASSTPVNMAAVENVASGVGVDAMLEIAHILNYTESCMNDSCAEFIHSLGNVFHITSKLAKGEPVDLQKDYEKYYADSEFEPGDELETDYLHLELENQNFNRKMLKIRDVLAQHPGKCIPLNSNSSLDRALRMCFGPELTAESIDASLPTVMKRIDDVLVDRFDVINALWPAPEGVGDEIFDDSDDLNQQDLPESEQPSLKPASENGKWKSEEKEETESPAPATNRLNAAKRNTLIHLANFAERQEQRRGMKPTQWPERS